MIRKIPGVLRTFKRGETLIINMYIRYVISLPLARSVNVNENSTTVNEKHSGPKNSNLVTRVLSYSSRRVLRE